jgi:hypothetical protein
LTAMARPNPITAHDGIREETYGRTLTGMRWHEGRLQCGFSEKYTQYAGGRLLTSGFRTIWEDVPGEMPAALNLNPKP